MRSTTGKRDIQRVKAALERIVESFKSDEVLSEFERGQVDALRWALQVIEELEE